MLFNTPFFKLNRPPLLLVFTSIILYLYFGYDLIRTDYLKLITLYSALFFVFYKLINILKTRLVFLTWLAFLFRAIFIMALPNLSQDFFRFIWDGRLLLEGINPYLHTVDSFISMGKFPIAQAQELHQGMGALNASHFTNYPPINQLCFTIAALISGKSILGSVIVMRTLIIAADFGTLFFGKKLLERLNMPAHTIFWYILNPFIIIELTGNLHFEGVMIFFLVWSLYLLHSRKWMFAAMVLGCSISVKLIPLMFLPLFFKWFMKNENVLAKLNHTSHDKKVKYVQLEEAHESTKVNETLPFNVEIASSALIATCANKNEPKNKAHSPWLSTLANITKLIAFYSITLLTVLLLFAPFYSEAFIKNYYKTVALWFQDFEFNASLYYVAREIGYLFRGYNEIAIIGKITPVLVILFVLFMTFFKKRANMASLITSMLFVVSFYYFTATTVHPWYIATLLILSVFTNYKFPLVWSFVIILSYLAYMNANNMENLSIIALEYTVVYGVFIWEIFINKKVIKQSL